MEPANVISLRQVLQSRFPSAHAVSTAPISQVKTGVAALDSLPLTAGTVSEIVSEALSTGSGLLLKALLSPHTNPLHEPVALVDGADVFDPQQMPTTALQHLLWVRCRDPIKAIRSTDLLLRDGNLPRVLLDLQLCPAAQLRQIPSPAWHRLRMLAEKSDALLCVFTAFQMVSCARTRLFLEQPLPFETLDAATHSLLSSLSGRTQQRQAGQHSASSTLRTLANAG